MRAREGTNFTRAMCRAMHKFIYWSTSPWRTQPGWTPMDDHALSWVTRVMVVGSKREGRGMPIVAPGKAEALMFLRVARAALADDRRPIRLHSDEAAFMKRVHRLCEKADVSAIELLGAVGAELPQR